MQATIGDNQISIHFRDATLIDGIYHVRVCPDERLADQDFSPNVILIGPPFDGYKYLLMDSAIYERLGRETMKGPPEVTPPGVIITCNHPYLGANSADSDETRAWAWAWYASYELARPESVAEVNAWLAEIDILESTD